MRRLRRILVIRAADVEVSPSSEKSRGVLRLHKLGLVLAPLPNPLRREVRRAGFNNLSVFDASTKRRTHGGEISYSCAYCAVQIKLIGLAVKGVRNWRCVL